MIKRLSPTTGAYVGRCPGCNEVCAATLIREGDEERIAETVAEFIRSGLIIERTSADAPRVLFGSCKCKKAEQLPFPDTKGDTT